MGIIDIHSITKQYSDIKALDTVTFNVHKGEILCLLGENGAGKTTLLRLISTLIKPTEGKIYIDGIDNIHNKKNVKGLLGLVTSKSKAFPSLTVKENLEFFSSFYTNNKMDAKNRVEHLINLLDLNDYSHKRVEYLSSGNKQKVIIAKAMVADPLILILDEPMNGLDVATQKVVKQTIKGLQEKGKTIIFTSHNMSDVERLAERVCVLYKGELVFDGDIDEIEEKNRINFLEKLLTKGRT